jgi:flagellar biosynthesis chaperone FliJ
LMQLQPIRYNYKNVGERTFRNEVLNTEFVGFSAQEVQKVFPEAVGIDADGYLNLNNHAILVAYLNAIKEQQSQIKQQEATIEAQKKELQDMNSRLERLEKMMEKK